jgi:preprotein translocase subunit SecG
MLKAIVWIEFISAGLLVASILMQNRGTGLGGVFASEANVYRSKRGVEKFLFNSTITLGIILVLGVLVDLYLRLTIAA